MLPPPRWPPQLMPGARHLGVDPRAALERALARSRAAARPAPGRRHEAARRRAHRARRELGRRRCGCGTARASRRSPPRCSGSSPSAPPQSIRFAWPLRMRSQPDRDRLGARAARARVGRDLVAEREQARDARGHAARHHLLDRRAAEPPHVARVGERDHLRADRVHAADAGADHRAACPSRRASSPGFGPREPGVAPGVDRGDRRIAVRRVHRALELLVEMLLDDRVDALRNTGDAAAEAELGELRVRADARRAAAQRGLELVGRRCRSARPRRGRSPPRAASLRYPHARERPRAHEGTVFALHLDGAAQLAAPEEHDPRRW